MPALRPPTVLGIFSGVVGAISIVSALTPSLADRSHLVQGLLPPGAPTAARWLALAFGLALVWLAGSLSFATAGASMAPGTRICVPSS